MKKMVVLLLIAGLAMTAYAQPRNTHTLTVNGSALSGNVSNGSGLNYEVRTSSAGTLVVETTGNTDTYLIAYNSSYNQVASDDDGGSGNNARISINVRANETYYFNVTGYSTSTSGSFNITAVLSGGGSGITELQLGTWVTSSIGSGETRQFRVRLDTDSYYAIQWDDYDRTHSGESASNLGDIRVGIRREGSSNYLIPISDSGNYTENYSSYSNEHRVYSNSSPKYDENTWYIIEVDAISPGNFRIYVY
ncbi:MAG: hypothetical protein FWG89_02080 [Treponema sp.]|nr:hypothetical protein [Treponema sp.]